MTKAGVFPARRKEGAAGRTGAFLVSRLCSCHLCSSSKLESVLRRGIAKREGNPWGGRQVRHWAGCLGHGLVLCVSKRELRAGCLPWKGSVALRLPGPWELIAVWGESE